MPGGSKQAMLSRRVPFSKSLVGYALSCSSSATLSDITTPRRLENRKGGRTAPQTHLHTPYVGFNLHYYQSSKNSSFHPQRPLIMLSIDCAAGAQRGHMTLCTGYHPGHLMMHLSSNLYNKFMIHVTCM